VATRITRQFQLSEEQYGQLETNFGLAFACGSLFFGWLVDRLPVRLLPLKSCFNLLLVHYPAWADNLGGRRCDLILAGHSHGGQVRLPFFGSLITPYNTGRYDLGRFETPGGPLYVNPGIGTLGDFEFRFNCRPEITLFRLIAV
jgi:hypothetical protein